MASLIARDDKIELIVRSTPLVVAGVLPRSRCCVIRIREVAAQLLTLLSSMPPTSSHAARDRDYSTRARVPASSFLPRVPVIPSEHSQYADAKSPAADARANARRWGQTEAHAPGDETSQGPAYEKACCAGWKGQCEGKGTRATGKADAQEDSCDESAFSCSDAREASSWCHEGSHEGSKKVGTTPAAEKHA